MPTASLPLRYWCRYEREPRRSVPRGILALTPGEALEWVREGVRDVVTELGADEFERAWSWLGDHWRRTETDRRSLRAGLPYTYRLGGSGTYWTWTVHPVRQLPLLDRRLAGVALKSER
ncbi:hypothetical protein ACQYWQ_13900 [Streptomyces sp. P6-2-1]|uniref:hypothetical protein n=1 Tax=unclassified Streptomyces TaxID=2593676 RepID=UPI003D36BAEE